MTTTFPTLITTQVCANCSELQTSQPLRCLFGTEWLAHATHCRPAAECESPVQPTQRVRVRSGFWPTAQATHSSPLAVYLPAAHGTHAVWFRAGAWPLAHCEHVPACELREYVLDGHGTQSEEGSLSWSDLPAAQAAQAVEPALAYVPGLHAPHALALGALLARPAAHCVHTVVPRPL